MEDKKLRNLRRCGEHGKGGDEADSGCLHALLPRCGRCLWNRGYDSSQRTGTDHHYANRIRVDLGASDFPCMF